MLHGNGSGFAEAESYGSVEASFLKILRSGIVLEAYVNIIYIYILRYMETEADSRKRNRMEA